MHKSASLHHKSTWEKGETFNHAKTLKRGCGWNGKFFFRVSCMIRRRCLHNVGFRSQWSFHPEEFPYHKMRQLCCATKKCALKECERCRLHQAHLSLPSWSTMAMKNWDHGMELMMTDGGVGKEIVWTRHFFNALFRPPTLFSP